ncbi:MAG: WD40 repeat domain-containing protein, partial [Phycisphaerales bacterium]
QQYSSEGSLLASGSVDQTIKIWRASDGGPLRAIPRQWGVSSLAFSPDGQSLASGGTATQLWRVFDGGELWFLPVDVESLAFSPSGRRLVLGCNDQTVRVARAKDGKLLRTMTGHTQHVTSVAYSPDGRTLASGSWDQTVRLWRASDGELLRTLPGRGGHVHSVAFSPDGQTLASGSGGSWGEDLTVRLWRVSDGELLRTLEGHGDWVRSVAFSPDGRTLASGGRDNSLRLWRVSDGAPLAVYDQEMGGDVPSVQYSPDAQHFAYGRADATLVVARNPFAPEPGCGVNARLSARCRRGGVRVIGIVKDALPLASVTFTLDGENPVERPTSEKGKAKVTYTGQAPGPHVVQACGVEAGC